MAKIKIDYYQLGQYINDKIGFEEVNTTLKYAFMQHNNIDSNAEITEEIKEAFKEDCKSEFFIKISKKQNKINLLKRLSYLGFVGLLGMFLAFFFFNTGTISMIIGFSSSVLCVLGLIMFVLSVVIKNQLTLLLKCFKCIKENKKLDLIELEENLDLCDFINDKKSADEINSIQKYIYSKLDQEENFIDFCRKQVLLKINSLIKNSRVLFWFGLIIMLFGIYGFVGTLLSLSNLPVVLINGVDTTSQNIGINIPVVICSIVLTFIFIFVGISMINSSKKKKRNAIEIYMSYNQM